MSGPEETNPISNFTTYDGEAQLTFDKSNNLYATMINVGDSLGVVYYITPGGISSTPFMMPEIPYIVGVVADASGHLYVSGFQNTSTSFTGSIVKLSPH
jgi:hypothetical protein